MEPPNEQCAIFSGYVPGGSKKKEEMMPLLQWKDEYSVKVRSIDAQHKKLVDLINQLHEAMSSGRSKEVLDRVFSELVTYTKLHFSNEEQMLVENGYPALGAHKKKHDDLTRQVMQYFDEFKSGRSSVSLPLMTFLKDWLINHIQGTDKMYSSFMNAKGVS
jgi:hemerythrin-like metal-binding protein